MPVVAGRANGLRRRCSVLCLQNDHGGVALIVALLLGSGLLLGMAALVIDVGYLYVERSQLQTGADAAALKVAQICADPANAADCRAQASTAATDYANDNANDGFAAATVCGRGGRLPTPCPPPAGNLTDCVRDAPPTGDYAEVHTSTLNADGEPLLPAIFAQAVFGFDGTEVQACARAAWGPPSRAKGFALTISACDWNRYTADGSAFPPVERPFPVYNEAASTRCPVRGGAGTGSGGFRWLTTADDHCRTTTRIGESYAVRTGDSRPRPECEEDVLKALRGRPVLVPVFSEIRGSGGNATYTISGFAAFVVTGWHLPDDRNRPACSSGVPMSCIYGYFTQAVLTGGGAVGGPDLGAQIVARVG